MIEQIQCDLVQAEVVTEVGHIAPVRFRLDVSGATVAQPYSLPTWTPEECTVDIPAIRWLRGEFFGFPLGVTDGAEHVHGAAANGPWDLTAKRDDRLTLSIDLGDLGGTLEKQVSLRPGHRVLYNQHTITGVEGRFNYGHHPSSIFPKADRGCDVRPVEGRQEVSITFEDGSRAEAPLDWQWLLEHDA